MIVRPTPLNALHNTLHDDHSKFPDNELWNCMHRNNVNAATLQPITHEQKMHHQQSLVKMWVIYRKPSTNQARQAVRPDCTL